MEDLRPEDFDDIDESTIEVHEARPVRGDEVSIVLSVPLEHDDYVALSALSKREGSTIFQAARDAIRSYAATRAPQRRAS